MRQDTTRLNKMRENIQRKLQLVEKDKSEVEGQRDTLKSQIGGLERGLIILHYYSLSTSRLLTVCQVKCCLNICFVELDVMKKQTEIDKKQTDELVRERDILNKNLLKVS